MKKCSMCGSQVNDDVTNCPNCGSVNFVGSDVFNQNIGAQQPMYGQNPSPIPPQPVKQQGNIGWGVLGFCIPIVGWILYFCWNKTKPGDAKYAGIGGIIGFCFNLIMTMFVL